MLIEPHEVARLSDSTLKRMVVAVHELNAGADDALAEFWTSFAIALVRVIQGRRREWLLIEAELLNDPDAEGALVGPDDDPVADALTELRGDRP